MTCREQLELDHPNWSDSYLADRIADDCPVDYKYHKKVGCTKYLHDCISCWNSQVEDIPRTN